MAGPSSPVAPDEQAAERLLLADPELAGLTEAEIERFAREALDGFRADWESGACTPEGLVGADAAADPDDF